MEDQQQFRAGERLKLVRLLLGLTQDKFSTLVGIPYNRLASIETLRARVSEDDFYKVCSQFPEFVAWLVFEGHADIKGLKISGNPLSVVAAAKLETKMIPEEFEHMMDYII